MNAWKGEGARVAVVAHPAAGAGELTLEDALRGLFRSLEAVHVVVPRSTMEAKSALRAGKAVREVQRPEGAGPTYAAQAALRTLEQGVDAVIALGGDGTLAAVANALASTGAEPPPLAGIGIGSANVGPLITALGSEVGELAWGSLEAVPVNGLRYTVNGRELGLAFNDVVFANTFFGTVDGVRVDLDASAMLDGSRQVAVPASVCSSTVRVRKNGRTVLSGRDTQIAQVVACPVNDPGRFLGTAVSGLLSWGPFVGCSAVLAASSAVLIRTRLTIDDLLAEEPLQLLHVAFGVPDELVVEGMLPGAVVVADGSPIAGLCPSNVVGLTLVTDAVRVFRRGLRQ